MAMDNLVQLVRFSLRSLRRSAGLSGAIVLTLALCIGANTSIVSVLYGLVLKPLPFADAGQLVEVYSSQTTAPKGKVGVQQYIDYKTNANLFEGFALWEEWAFNTAEGGGPVRGAGAEVTADYFRILGVRPLLGRFFSVEECVPGNDAVLVLTQDYWEREFHADPEVIGRGLTLSGVKFVIIGVAPRSLEALNNSATLLKPFAWSASDAVPQYRGSLACTMYARVKPGVPHTEALAQLQSLERNFLDHVAGPDLRDYLIRTSFKMGLGQVRAVQTKSIRASLLILQGGALLVLLLGCVSVVNLMLARINSRQSEFAVRQALGAGFGALAGQMLVEGLMLAGGAAAIGLALVWAALRVANTYVTTIVREVQPITIDLPVLGAAILSASLIAIVISVLPTMFAWRRDLLSFLQSGARGATASRGARVTSGYLVAAQVAPALILLAGAGLLLRSFTRVMAVNPGFDAKHVVQGRIVFGYPGQSWDKIKSVQDLIIERMREIPGVNNVAYTFESVVGPIRRPSYFPIRGSTARDSEAQPAAMVIAASPEYFAAMGIRLLEGRTFTEEDYRPQARLVYVVDQNFAARYLPGRSAVGATFDFWNPDRKADRWPMVIGVVAAAKLSGLDETSGTPFVFAPRGASQDFSLVIRTVRPASEIVPLMREKLRSVDPSAPLYLAGSLDERLNDMLADRRGVMALLCAFAGIAVLVSGVGIYALLVHEVEQRTREIGIRGALGATHRQIVALILSQGLAKFMAGWAVGLGGAFLLSRYMTSLLFEVEPADPVTFVCVSGFLLLVALFASWLPAQRAARIDPVITLRTE